MSPKRDTLAALLEQSRREVAKMTPDEIDAMVRRQIEGVVRAEMSWPKPRYEWVGGVKVYAGYEDYVND